MNEGEFSQLIAENYANRAKLSEAREIDLERRLDICWAIIAHMPILHKLYESTFEERDATNAWSTKCKIGLILVAPGCLVLAWHFSWPTGYTIALAVWLISFYVPWKLDEVERKLSLINYARDR